MAGFRRQMAGGLRLTLAILVPAAVGYVVLAHPFITLFFHHGSFSSQRRPQDRHRRRAVRGRAAGVQRLSAVDAGLPGHAGHQVHVLALRLRERRSPSCWPPPCTRSSASAVWPSAGCRPTPSVPSSPSSTCGAHGWPARGTATAWTSPGSAVATAVMFAAVWAVRARRGPRGSDLHLAVTVGAWRRRRRRRLLSWSCRFLGVTICDAHAAEAPKRRGAHWADRRA